MDESRETTSAGGTALPASAALPLATPESSTWCHAVAESRPLAAHINTSSGRDGPSTGIQTFDSWQPLIVHPSEIKPGDSLADLGTLRQVEYVDTIGLSVSARAVHIVHFVRQDGVENLVRGFSDGASLTVWRSAGV
jgi:hypothetical protein